MHDLGVIGQKARNDNASDRPLMEVEEFRLNGKLHRIDGPAFIGRDKHTGAVCREEYWQEDFRNRIDGPALIKRDAATGEILAEQYWVRGRLHRREGPASIRRNALTLVVTSEIYKVRGVLHRKSGPAVIWRDSTIGKLLMESYWLCGRWQEPEAFRLRVRPKLRIV